MYRLHADRPHFKYCFQVLCTVPCHQSRRKDPPSPPAGEPHACSGASCCVGEPFWAHQNAKNLLVAGAAPRTPLGSLQRSPRPPSWRGGAPRGALLPPSPRTPLTILSLCLSCVYVHACVKMHCYFLLNVKHEASQLCLGGASNYLAPALYVRSERGVYEISVRSI